jgi:aldehyde dehydrogenase (NAD+)
MEQRKNLIAGEWLNSAGASENINPSDTDDMVGTYARGDVDDIAAAVHAAQIAFQSWSSASPQVRADILDAAGTEILSRVDDLGVLLAREEGKPLAEAKGEVIRAGQIFKYFAGEAVRAGGEWFNSTRPKVLVDVRREPVGIIGIISPWNFPIAIPAWKIAPALAFGNCVIFKPAELAPGCSWEVADILVRVGIPSGVFNLVMGKGSVVGQAIIDHPGIHAVSFTGSVETGKQVLNALSKRRAKVQLEMGGKNPLIVLKDADLDVAVECAVNGAYFSSGQRCTASSRLLVEEGVHDSFVHKLTERMKSLKVGHALAADTIIGPVVDQNQLDQDLYYIEEGKDEGAELVHGGQTVECSTTGYYLEPALFIGTTNDMRINREEVFGPVACVIKVKDFEESIAVANDTEYGLSAGICTASLKYAEAFKNNIQAGMCMVNLPTAGVDYHVPFGGYKGSSLGSREQGAYAREFYTKTKTSYTFPN